MAAAGARQKLLPGERRQGELPGGRRLAGDKPPASRAAPTSSSSIPYKPVPTRGGAVCCNPKIFPWGPMDQRPVEKRKDVLVYTTKPAQARPGSHRPMQAVLYVSPARGTRISRRSWSTSFPAARPAI